MKVIYLHGRHGPHIMHGRLAKSLDADFQKIDHYKIWNEANRSRLQVFYAWIYNAFAFKNPKQYDLFLISGPHFSPIIMKFFRLNKKQKVVAHLGDETMYFLYINYYGKLMQKLLIWLLNQYDALMCEGQMAADLAKLNGINKPKLFTTYLGVPKERELKLVKINRKAHNNNFAIIASGPKGWRTFYKGLDLMIDAFSEAYLINPTITYTIIGKWDAELQESLLQDCTAECRKSIRFLGHVEDIESELSKANFYLHTSRGDAFPTVVLEAMMAGLIPIVSEWTGSKEVVGKVDTNCIVKLDKGEIVAKILEFAAMDNTTREDLSKKMRNESLNYTEEFALNHYRETFAKFASTSE